MCGRIRQHWASSLYFLFGLDIEVYKLENMEGTLFLRIINSFIICMLMHMNMTHPLFLSTPKEIWV